MRQSVPPANGDALERIRQLESLGDVALAHLGLDDMLGAVLDRVRDALQVDTVAVLLLDEETRELVARSAKGLEEEVEQGVRIPFERGFAGRIAAQARPVVIDDLEHADIFNPILREKGIQALLGVPLLFEGDVLGVLHVGSLSPREFTAEDTRLLELAASRIGPALAHARAYEAERDAREAAEAALAELRALQAITDAALAHMGLEELLDELLERLRGTLAADTAAILLLDSESNELVARAARGLEEEVERGVRIAVGRGFAGRIAAEGRIIEIVDIDQAEVANPILRKRGLRSLLGAPLVIDGEVGGVLHVGTTHERVFSDADKRLLQLAADRIAMTLDHSRLLREHHMTLTLQESLVPERLPDLPGLTIAARYRPGRGAAVGGDWYDALPLPGGGIALVMGDAASRGLRAARVVGQLRHALRTYALEGDPPARVVARLADLLRTSERRELVTLTYVALDPDAGELRVVSAGHPPPLVIDGTSPLFLEGSRGAPLGAVANPRYEEAVAELPPEGLVVLYTDGLVERRDRRIDDGLQRLAAVAADGHEDPERTCDAVVAALVDEGTMDDVALLVARTVAHTDDRFDMRLPAHSESLVVLRRSLRQWLKRGGATEDDVTDVLVAVGEAAGNAVEHAYGPGDATFEVSGTLSGGQLELAVRDFGDWRPPRGQNRGRGTLLMQELMDSFDVRTSADGTEVRMGLRLGQERRP